MTEVRKQPELDARSLEAAAVAIIRAGDNVNDKARAAILAFLEAERAQDRAMMPRVASDEMCERGSDAHANTWEHQGEIAAAGHSWRAMFDAFDAEVRKQAGDVS